MRKGKEKCLLIDQPVALSCLMSLNQCRREREKWIATENTNVFVGRGESQWASKESRDEELSLVL